MNQKTGTIEFAGQKTVENLGSSGVPSKVSSAANTNSTEGGSMSGFAKLSSASAGAGHVGNVG